MSPSTFKSVLDAVRTPSDHVLKLYPVLGTASIVVPSPPRGAS